MSESTSDNLLYNNSYCPALFEFFCWPQTDADELVNISCSALRHPGVDSSKFFSRYCLPSGKWSNVSFAPCFYPDILALLDKSYIRRPPEEREVFERIVRALRYFELAGLSISLTSILISLFIFFSFKSLHCDRTKIHINLLLAILIQIIARLTTYGLQMVQLKNSPKNECDVNGSVYMYPKTAIFDGICPLFISFLQFGITAMFMWMLCEGIHLHSILTVSVFKNHFKTYYFHIIGWVLPFCLTLSWSIIMFIKERDRRCFNNYNHLKYYWVIDGPRYAVMIINIIFLLNITRVLMVKIKEGSEKQLREDKRRGSMNVKSLRKAVKAAIFLLPLLGITYVLETFTSADDKPLTIFAVYSSINVFLMTLQGFFCSLLYCFLNVEVRETISRRLETTQFWYRWKQYLGKKDQFRNRRASEENRTYLDPNSNSPKKSPMELEECHLTADIDGNIQN
ncbi:unnamed protein product [Rotaria socialis]|uniref:Uncharacterized protein n=1 Tax=Rotaria socialis TaxID=392032 RepID=A0A819V8T4_9BILA|nr:unnamed protein product [Rotaria socialis]CAF4105296.1 unnamed protein product [Rotaria socialis]